MTPFGFGFGKRSQLFVSEAFGGAPDASAVSSYIVSPEGDLEVVSPSVATSQTGDGSGPLDMAFSSNGRYLYSLNGGNNTSG